MIAAEQLSEQPPGVQVVASAPGRANLLGEYTDINDGFVLPVALTLRTVLAGRRAAGVLRVQAKDLPGEPVVEVDLHSGAGPRTGWGRYLTAVVASLRTEGASLSGFDGALSSDVPIGAGLSSSAALGVAVALAVLDQPMAPLRLARLCQRAENDGVGVQSGLMDPLASAGAHEGSAMLIDCRDGAVEHVPLPTDLTVMIIDCGVSRRLADSAYNARRSQCQAAAAALGMASLRDVGPEDLPALARRAPGVVSRRGHHVVSENQRVLATAEALRRGDRPALGSLMAASHASLRDDFDVSIPALDTLVTLACATAGVVGSRLTGAGFGGCTVSLVESTQAPAVLEEVLARYRAETTLQPRGWLSSAGAGASVS